MAAKDISEWYLKDVGHDEEFRRTALTAILRGMGPRTYLIDMVETGDKTRRGSSWRTTVCKRRARGVTVDPGRRLCTVTFDNGIQRIYAVDGKYFRVYRGREELRIYSRKWLIKTEAELTSGSNPTCECASAR